MGHRLLSAILALASTSPLAFAGPPHGISATGEVAHQGLRFRLPPGHSYEVEEEGGTRRWSAVGEAASVTVSAAHSDSELPCVVDSPGVDVRPFRTAGGYRACLLAAAAGHDALAFAFVKGGDVLVTIVGVGGAPAATALAEAVAESVRIDAARTARAALPRLDQPKVDPALVGCFRQREGTSFDPSVVIVSTWCFEGGGAFTQETKVASSSVAPRTLVRRGRWGYAAGHLELWYEDGDTARRSVKLGDGDLLADGKVWERQ